MFGQNFGDICQQRGIGFDPVPISPAEKSSDGLTGGLPKDIPQCDINPADRVGNRATPAQSEGVLMQFFADPLRFQCILAPVKRFQYAQRGPHKIAIGKYTADAGHAFIC